MKCELVEITKDDFDRLSQEYNTYFQNGVIFENRIDNVVAFMMEDKKTLKFTYWKVVEKN